MPTSEPAQPSQFETLTQLFLTAIDRHHKPDAFLVKSGGSYQGISSAEALTKAATLTWAFERFGVAPGDRVAILSENRLEWALTDYALLGLGAISVPIYPTLLEPEVDYILRDSAAKGIVVSTADELRKILNIHSRLPDLRLIVVMDDVSSTDGSVQSWHRLAGRSDGPGRAGDPVTAFRTRALAVRPEDTASILYTSGTTGALKGVVLTHANIASNVAACEQLFPLGRNDVAMSFLPLSHIFERTLDYAYFWRGVSIAYAESYDTLPQNLLEVRPTVMAVVPRILQKVNEKVTEVVRQSSSVKQHLFRWAIQAGRDGIPYSLQKRTPPLGRRAKLALADKLVYAKVRERLGGRIGTMISGAAPLSRELAEFFWAVGLPVYEGYGLTETSPVIAVNCPGAVKLGTVGRVISGVELKLGEEAVDEEGRAGREILVRGPNVTPGYYHLNEENRQAFVNGWFYTGDLGLLDADGYLRITGRKKNLFKTAGGKFVSPEKLENLFQEHPYISQIVVLGEGRKFVGALIVPNFTRLESYARSQGLTFSSRKELVLKPEIYSFIEQQVEEATRWLPPHEKIRQFALLPREFTIAAGEISATLKIKRPVVEEHYRDAIEEIYLRHAPQAQSV
jgi:long-chain acyl-CoA synthetase